MAQYLALQALSSGLCNTLLAQSPLHAKAEQDGVSEPSEVSEMGEAIHDALLEGVDRIASINPEDYRSKPTKANPEGAVPKGWTNGAIKAAREAARAEGKLPMLSDKVGRVTAAVSSAKSYIATTVLKGIFDRGESEVTFVWQEGAILCKARADRWTPEMGILLHVKTSAGSVAPHAFQRVADSMGYDLAVMFYERGMEAVAPGKLVKSYILAIEQEVPHGCKLYDLHELKKEIAAANVERAIQAWGKCIASGIYPAYGADIYTLEPKPWQLAEAETSGTIGGLAYHEPDPLQVKHGMQI